MSAQKIDLLDDPWVVVFKIGDKEYRADSLVFSSIIMDKAKGDDDPPKEVILEAMKEALDSTEGLTDHLIFAMSVRLTKAMTNAGKG
jgi:hypothetical protein